MNAFWIAAACLSALAALRVAWPFLTARLVETSAADGAMSIYRDQIDEVERDHAAGLIEAGELDAARMEIERRALRAARYLDQGLAVARRSIPAAVTVSLLLVAIGSGVYAWVGAPGEGDRPLAARQEEQILRMAKAGDETARAQLLIRRLEDDPESFEDWWMLAQSYAGIGDYASATDAYRRAALLSDDRPGVLSAYAEAMTLANGNKVPTAARVIFDQLAHDIGDPRARYYVALAKAQDKDFEGATEGWMALAADSDPAAPWMPMVRRDLMNMARFLERDIGSVLPEASPDEVLAAGGSLLPGIDSPKTTNAVQKEDWRALIAEAEVSAERGDMNAARTALETARAAFPGAPFVLEQIALAERQLGLTRGPSDTDIAAAAEMTVDEREDMIEGMVAGLAARLETEPNDLSGWIMLVRSYATLGRTDTARDAYHKAEAHFDGDTTALARLSREVGEIVR